MDASVVVCTRDRAASLAVTLESIAGLRIPALVVAELVVVDNGSTDGTPAVVEAFRRRSPLPLRYVRELRPGIAPARNAGMAAARGRIVVFTDDDVTVEPDWLAEMLEAFRR